MKSSSFYLVLATFTVAAFFSCSKPNEVSKMVPADAAVVVHINAGSLSSKLSWQDIQSTSWFQEINSQAPDSLAKALLSDPSKSGIDADGDLVFFVQKEGKLTIVGLQGKIKDEAAFEAFNRQVAKGSATNKSGDYSSLAITDKGIVTWKDKRFCYLINADVPSANQYGMGDEDGAAPQAAITVDSLRLINKGLFELDSDNSLGSNKKFSTLIKEEGDVHLWLNSETLYSELGAGMLSMMRLNVLFQGNISATTFNFDNGKITMNSRQYYGEEMTNLIKKYSPKAVDADVINRIPSKNVFGAFVMNYPPEGLKEFLKLIGVDGMTNAYLGEAGYSIDEFVKANKGDIVLAFTDLSVQEKTMTVPGEDGQPYTHKSSTPDMKFLFSTSINDKAAFDKLVAKIQSTIPQEATAQLSQNMTYKLDNNWFVASNSPEYANSFLAKNDNKLPFTDKISGHPFGGYIDIQKIMAAGGTPTDSTARTALDASMKMWQDVVFYGGEIKDGAMVSHAEVNMVDKNTNSLKQLNRYADQLAQTLKNKKQQQQYDMPQQQEDVVEPGQE